MSKSTIISKSEIIKKQERNYLVKNKLFLDFLRSCFDFGNTIKN